jgi:benzylsuccinate CoA-transferase BbsE subunit
MLSPYRVLDLADEKGLFCGKLLGDLGADVIKVERPGGDPARSIGPFYHDEPDPEKSLFWFAFNTSKRGITLDIETADGHEIFKRLVKTADIVVESFPPGYLDKLGLGYSALEKENPGIILVSITPFGQTGPYRDYKGPGIAVWAMGGPMYVVGDADRPPVQISHHSHAYLHASAEAGVGAMFALYYRQLTGEGQHVDQSIHSAVAQINNVTPTWDMMRQIRRRSDQLRVGMKIRAATKWPCKDGHVLFQFSGGPLAQRNNPAVVKWLDAEGAADDYLRGFDWTTFDLATSTQETIDQLERRVGRFFMSRTKAELLEGAVKYRVMLYPVANAADILQDTQLAIRDFWVQLEHPELGTTIPYPGGFGKATETPPRVWRRAPLIGEHNREIYEEELGIPREEILALKQARVI